jgi:hypothetical protein
MLVELPVGGREALRPLYCDYPYLHGAVEAGISAAFGEAVADDAQRPAVACIHLEFWFLAGDPAVPAARRMVERIVPRASVVAPGADWERLLREVWGSRVEPHERVVHDAPPAWDQTRLKEQVSSLAPGFEIVRIDASTVAAFRALDDAFMYNFPSNEVFLRDGVGFGILHEEQFVAGCSSFTLGGGKLEFEIETRRDLRERDLATAVGARMILHCLANDLVPCWDAHNPPSGGLATKLGFVNPLAYRSFYVD